MPETQPRKGTFKEVIMHTTKRNQPLETYVLENLDTRFKSRTEELKGFEHFGDVLEHARVLAADIYFGSENPELLQTRLRFERQSTPEEVKAVINLQDFSALQNRPRQLERLYEALSFKERLARQLIRQVIESSGAKLNLNPSERIGLLAGLDTLDVFDRLYPLWKDKVSNGTVEKSIASLSPADALLHLQHRGVITEDHISRDEYWYQTFQESTVRRAISTKTYSQAFPREYRQLDKIVEKAVEQLQAISNDTQAKTLKDYYSALRTARNNTDPNMADELWSEVDRKWKQIQGRFLPLHEMEVYEDPLGKRVDMEQAICMLDDRGPATEVNAIAITTRNNVADFLELTFGAETPSISFLMNALKNSRALLNSILGAGKRLTSRPAAENLPNRGKDRKEGVIIIQDTETFAQRWEIQLRLLKKILPQKIVEEFERDSQRINQLQAGVFVAGHEYSHNAFIQEFTRTSLGDKQYSLIEEHKSDMVSVAAAPDLLKDPRDRALFVKGLLATQIRSLARRNDISAHPYWNGSLVLLNLMQDSGVITINEDGTLTTDFSDQNITQFFNGAREVLKEIFEVYNACDPRDFQPSRTKYADYVERRFKESERFKALERSMGVQLQ